MGMAVNMNSALCLPDFEPCLYHSVDESLWQHASDLLDVGFLLENVNGDDVTPSEASGEKPRRVMESPQRSSWLTVSAQ